MSDKINDTVRIDGTDSNSECGKTKRINEQNNTDAGITKRVETGGIIKAGLGSGLSADDSEINLYELNGITYRLIRKISEATSEAQIYLIEKDAEQFILKYYYPFIKPKLAVINKLRKISHPDIISVIDYGYYEERFFEILTYADQGALTEQIPIRNKSKLKKIISEINSALKYCHDNGIIHRDIKPSNIFLKDKNRHDVVVGDFGIASIIDEGEVLRRTTIFQTPIYSAPEFKMSLRGETIITKAVDYYSLGITVWEMAVGALPPRGMDELEFLREMFEGTPPLPNNLDSDIKTLIRGLTWRSYKQRWGYDEVVKWLKGEITDLPDDKVLTPNTMFLFDKDVKGNEIIAETSEELARLIYENPEQGRKHLYRGTIKEWLRQNNDQNLLLEIADITEYKFKDDEEAGTQYAVYMLDKNFPFYSLQNKPLRTKQELVNELRMNYKVYANDLKYQNHKFYLYLLSKNAHQDVEKFLDEYKKKSDEYAFYFVLYTLEFSINKNAPFAIFTNGVLTSLIKSVEELADYFIKKPSSRKPILLSADFWVWIKFKNNELASSIKKIYDEEKSATKNFLGQLPYLLAPNLGYKGVKGNKIFSLYDIGKEFYENFESYRESLKDKESEIFYYLKSNGCTGEISFIEKCFKPDKKPAPYSNDLALIKIIKGFEYDLPYNINGKQYHKPNDLLNDMKGSAKIKDELSNQFSFLNMWLAVFFHEQPLSEDKKFYIYYMEDFEEQLKAYLEFIRKLNKNNKIIDRYDEARDKIKKLKTNYEKLDSNHLSKKIFFLSLPAIPAILLILYSIFINNNPLPFNIFSISKWYFLTIIFLVTGYIFKSMYDSNDVEISTGCVGGPILGLITAVILYYIIYLIVAFPLILLIMLGASFYFLYTTLYYFIDEYLNLENIEASYIDIEGLQELVFSYTFKKINKISIKESAGIKDAHTNTNNARLMVWAMSLIPALILLAILFVLVYYTPDFNLLELL